MVDLAPPPQLYIPAKPAIIRAHQGDLDALTRLERERGVKAMLPGMVPVIAGAAAAAPLTLTYIGSTATTADVGSGGTRTYAGVNIGSPAADRTVIVGIFEGGAVTVGTVTVAGVSCIVPPNANINPGAGTICVAMAYGVVAAGSTGDVAIVASGTNRFRGAIHIWTLTGNGALADADEVVSSSANSISMTGLTVPAGGVGVVVAARSGSTTISLTNATKQAGADMNPEGNSTTTCGSTTVAGTNTITATTADSGIFGMCGLSFPPA